VSETAAPLSSGVPSTAAETPPGRGAAAGPAAATPAAAGASNDAAGRSLLLRDQALAALDEGDPTAALTLAADGLAVLEAAGLGGGPDAAAVLVARAEIEESLDRFGDAAASTTAAIALLGNVAAADDDGDCLLLWCQAQERLAGLERLAGDFGAATARLEAVLDRASATLGEASPPVVSAANALGVVYKYAADFDAAEAAYRRAMAAADAQADPDPLTLAVLLHNLGGLAHGRGDAATGIPLAERGAALRAEAMGAVHPDVARDWNALGALYHLAGRFTDAGQACRRALAVFEDHYGPDHLEVAMTCANLAVLHSDQGHCAEAEAAGRRSLRIFEATLGPDDAEVGLTLLNLAAAVDGQGRRAEAADLAARAAAILTARLPHDHPHVVAAGQALGRWRPPS
jgi:tetratricopeptide (TPR) repeat protein